MTAIAGYWSFGAPAAARACAAMLAAQEAFGPSHRAQHDLPPISLGRNLTGLLPEERFDVSPITGAGGRFRLVADIRLDNREELGRSLGQDSRAISDAELAMRAIERWGDDALERLYGDFALALWDDERRRLVLARDPTGQKPLHYHRGAGFFAFASMPRGLHALTAIPRRVDSDAIADFLGLLPESGSGSFFEGVKKIPAGHVAEIRGDSFNVRRWWRPSRTPLAGKRPEDHAEALREALDRAVDARLRGTGSAVASHLSAGLDSAAVTATAARLLLPVAGQVVAYTAVPREHYAGGAIGDGIADEGPLATATAAQYANIDHVLVRGSERSPLAGLEHDVRCYERPMLNVANMPWVQAINDDARRRGLHVLLTGAVGNMSLTYDGLHALPDLLTRGRWLQLTGLLFALHRNGSRWGTLASRAVGPFVPRRLWQRVRRGRRAVAIEAEGPLLRAGPLAELSRRAGQMSVDAAARPLRHSVEARLDVLSGVDPGNYNAGTFAGWGLEPRDPTADRALIELCLRIPAEAWLQGGRPRGLARLTLADRLPAAVVNERRKGSQAADWHEAFAAALSEIREEMDQISACPSAADMLDVDRMRSMVAAWPNVDPAARATYHLYRQTLLRAVAAGHFMRSIAA